MKIPPKTTLARWILGGGLLLAAVLWLPRLDPQARSATEMALMDRGVARLEVALPKQRPGYDRYHSVLIYRGDAPRYVARIRERLGTSGRLKVGDTGQPLVVDLDLAASPPRLTLAYAPESRIPVTVSVTHRFIPAWSVLPPLVAIVLAFVTLRLVFSLLTAILLGGLLAVGPNPIAFVGHSLKVYLWQATFSDPFKLWILAFTCALIGMVQVSTRAGGVQGIVDRIATLARSARSTQIATALMGVAIFFDDYANTILVGSTMRPLTDAMRVSREKLSYLVDSTSAPVAGVAIISTWIGYEVGLFTDIAHSLGLHQDGYQLFFSALPYRFYCLFTLVFLGILLGMGRDYGPMLRAERRAHRTGEVIRAGAVPLASRTFTVPGPREGVRPLARVAVVPIAVVLVGTVVGLLWDGGAFATLAAHPTALFTVALWRGAFGSASDSTMVLFLASAAGSVAVFALALGHRLLSPKDAAVAYGRGVASMYLAIVILLLAWGIKATCDDLGTSYFLVAGLEHVVNPALLPMIIFLLAALVSFATGTSWGTMGILIPTAVPLAYHLGGLPEMYISMAAVLDGAIFGDHCSPISDTTVMSSIASGSDHLDHVRTQIPYALTAMGFAAVFGYLWDATGLPYWAGWLIGIAGMAVFIRVVGRKARDEAAAPSAT